MVGGWGWEGDTRQSVLYAYNVFSIDMVTKNSYQRPRDYTTIFK